MAEEERRMPDEIADDEVDAQDGGELRDDDARSPMNPAAPVGGAVIQPPPPDA